jgi:hypothetical protein
MLAVFGCASHSTAVHRLETDDRIAMYIDEVVDASNAAGDFFGHDALCDLLTRTRELSPAMAADSIISSVRQWSGKQDDDLTILICDYISKRNERGGSFHPRFKLSKCKIGAPKDHHGTS